jgi:hypothetical protein
MIALRRLEDRRVVLIAHPSGLKMFGGKAFDDEADARAFVNEANQTSELIHYRVIGGKRREKWNQKELRL